MNRFLIVAFLFHSFVVLKAQKKELMDSLNRYINASKHDTERVQRINKVYQDELWRYNSAEPYRMLKEAMKISKKRGYLRGEMMTYRNMIGYCRNRGHLQFAKKYILECKRIALQLGDTHNYAVATINQAMCMRDEGKADSALALMLQGLNFYQQEGASKDQMARLYYQLSSTYNALKDKEKAFHYARRSLTLREEINYGDGIDASLNQIAGYYAEEKNYLMIIGYAGKALRNRMEVKDSARMCSYMAMIGHAHAMLGKTDSAFYYLDYAMGILKRNANLPVAHSAIYQQYSEACEAAGDTEKALQYYKIAIQFKDSSYNLEASNNISKAQVLFDVEEKENQIMLLDQEKKVQQYGLIVAGLVLVTVLLISFFIYKAYRQKKKANVQLSDQKKIIEEKNKEVMDSINYARRLQSAILLPEPELRKYLGDAFILFKPRNIVSGDFYWYSESDRNRIIAVADCTGHGVPGGFMSMLGYECLQDVALKENINTTAEALSGLNRKITDTLNKSEKTFRDGMDICLCAFSKTERIVQFSGANRGLVHVSEGILREYKPDKFHIGGDIDNMNKEFTFRNIAYKDGDRFYLFTDGFADQFGGPKGKKFKSRNLQELLLQTSSLSMSEQKSAIEKTFDAWKGNLEQIDDVCLIGIRVE